jgi:hypothetical protein
MVMSADKSGMFCSSIKKYLITAPLPATSDMWKIQVTGGFIVLDTVF